MADAVLTSLLFLAGGAAVLLAWYALRHWHGERAGRAYELPVDQRGTVLRAAAAGVAALLAATAAVPLFHTAGAARPRPRAVAVYHPAVVPPPPARTPEPAPPAPQVRTLGRPAGGVLQVLRDGTRVWLPPGYSTRSAAAVAYPVVIVHTSATDPDLYPAFARQASRRRADSFLLVSPLTCSTDPGAVLAEVATRYRALTARTARGVIGVGAQAACAVRQALSRPDRFAAAAGLSGSYPAMPRPAGRRPFLLLATTAGESGSRASDARLRTSLHATGDQVRLLDHVPRRRDMLAEVASYLTEKLDGPTRTAKGRLTRAPGTVSDPASTAPAHRPAPTSRAATPSVQAPAGTHRPPARSSRPAPHSAPRSAPHSAPHPAPRSAPHTTTHAGTRTPATTAKRKPAPTAARPAHPAPHRKAPTPGAHISTMPTKSPATPRTHP